MGNYQGAAFVCGISSALTSVDCCQLAHTTHTHRHRKTDTHAQHVIGRCLLGVVSNRQLRLRNVAHSAALTKSGNWDGSSNWKWNWSRNWTWNWKWNCHWHWRCSCSCSWTCSLKWRCLYTGSSRLLITWSWQILLQRYLKSIRYLCVTIL